MKLISLLHTWRNFKSLPPAAAVAKRRRVSLISPPLPEEISMKQGIKSQKTTLPSVEYARLLFLSLALAFVNTRQHRAISPARMETNASPLHNLIANKYPRTWYIQRTKIPLSERAQATGAGKYMARQQREKKLYPHSPSNALLLFSYTQEEEGLSLLVRLFCRPRQSKKNQPVACV